MENLIGKSFAGDQIIELIDDTDRTLVYKGYRQFVVRSAWVVGSSSWVAR
jgi:hypothetical protein